MSHSRGVLHFSNTTSRGQSSGTSFIDSENAPLLDAAGPSKGFSRHLSTDLDSGFDSPTQIRSLEQQTVFHSSDESYFFDFMMEKVKSTRFAHIVDKLAVESEPGLTNAQLMLNNHDLKPVEPARRQWGPWNFVGFWVADSFNIVRYYKTSRMRNFLTNFRIHG